MTDVAKLTAALENLTEAVEGLLILGQYDHAAQVAVAPFLLEARVMLGMGSPGSSLPSGSSTPDVTP